MRTNTASVRFRSPSPSASPRRKRSGSEGRRRQIGIQFVQISDHRSEVPRLRRLVSIGVSVVSRSKLEIARREFLDVKLIALYRRLATVRLPLGDDSVVLAAALFATVGADIVADTIQLDKGQVSSKSSLLPAVPGGG